MRLKFTTKNAEMVKNKMRYAPLKVQQAIDDGIYKVGGYTLGAVKEHINAGTDMYKPPVKTGRMRQSISLRWGKGTASIHTSRVTPYAVYVHEGTGRMKARPFMDITAKHEEPAINRIFNMIIRDRISKL